eukprot:m.39452 g.39452  ORF g.39452 m.39452 type:complete len:797 (-) comp10309_c0_seq1:1489-3879(-)
MTRRPVTSPSPPLSWVMVCALVCTMSVLAALSGQASAANGSDNVFKVKWYQNSSHLFVWTVDKCTTAPEWRFELDYMHLSCPKHIPFDMQLREDIKPEESSCVRNGKTTKCAVTKREPHWFDRLPFDIKQYGAQVSIDWDNYIDEEIEEKREEEHTSIYEETDVVMLTQDNFESTVAQYKYAIVDFDLSWCQLCNNPRPVLARIAKKWKETRPDVLFAYVDIVENPALRHKYGTTCDMSLCYWVVFDNTLGEHFSYEAHPTIEMALPHIEMWTQDPLVPVKTERDIDDILDQEQNYNLVAQFWGTAVVAFLDPEQYPKETHLIRSFAQSDRHKNTFALVKDGNLGLDDIQPPCVAIFRAADDGHDSISTQGLTKESLKRFTEIYRVPLMPKFNMELRRTLDELVIPTAFLFLQQDDTHEELVEPYLAVAEKFRGQIAFVSVPREFHYLMEDFGLHTFPSFGIANNLTNTPDRYALLSTEATPEKAEALADAFLKGTAEKVFKSLDPPTPDIADRFPVYPFVYRELDNLLSSENDMIFLFAVQMGSHWFKYRKAYSDISTAVKGVDGVQMGLYDIRHNFIDQKRLPSDLDESADVTRMMVKLKGSTSFEEYKGKVKRKPMLEWLRTKVTAIDAAWDSVSQKLDEAYDKLRAKAREDKEFSKQKDEWLSSLPEEEVADGIVKQVIEAGDGIPVPNGHRARVIYKGWLTNGKKFDETEEEPFAFTVGGKQAIECWDVGVAAMTRGEKALLTCQADKAYGQNASGKIPPNSVLIFYIELLDHRQPVMENGSSLPPEHNEL